MLLPYSITVGICSKEQNTIIAGDFPFSFGSFINNLLQKWKYSAMLKFSSVLKNVFPAFLLSPFLLFPPIYHSGLLPYAFFPMLYGISAITNCAFGILYLL